MTNEDDFIKEWKMFYDNDSTVVNDVSERRMRMLLEGFKLGIKVEPIIIHEKVIIEKEVLVQRAKGTTPATMTDLLNEAQSICTKHSIPMSTLRRTVDKSRIIKNVEARIDFVRTVRTKFYSSLPELANFLNLDHTTVIYYLQGKKRIAPKNKVA